MKSVGEAMSLGRNFTEALQKALRSVERPESSLHWDGPTPDAAQVAELLERIRVPTDGRIVQVQQALRGGATVEQVHEATGIDPWFLDQVALLNEVAERVRARRPARPGAAAPGQAARVQRPPARLPAEYAGGGRPRGPPRPGGAAGVQDGRHVRRRVRRVDALPLLQLRRGERGRPPRARGGRHPRVRPQPDRPGRGVRLLLRPRLLRLARRRLRHRHGQLQPRDRVHRLRHEQPAVLRAAHPRGRPGGGPRRVAGRAAGRRHRPARRADAARAGPGPQGRGRPHRRHDPRGDQPRRGPRRVRPGARRGRPARTQARHGIQRPGRARGRARHRLPGARAPVLRARRARHGDRLRRRDLGHVRRAGHGRLAGAPGARRPLPRRRAGDRRRRALRRRGHVPRRGDGAHRGGRHPLRRQRLRAAAGDHGPRRHRAGARVHRSSWRRGSGCAA